MDLSDDFIGKKGLQMVLPGKGATPLKVSADSTGFIASFLLTAYTLFYAARLWNAMRNT